MPVTPIIKHDYKACDYLNSVKDMEKYIEEIISNDAPDKIWFLEHKDVYTEGSSAEDNDLIDKSIKTIKTKRGGKITYHGKNMRIIYLMLDLKRRDMCDVKKYVYNLEQIIINLLARLNIKAQRHDKNHIGVWIKDHNGKLNKISAIGVRIRKWVAFHGIAFNLNPDLKKFSKIIPCGINDDSTGVTSLAKLSIKLAAKEFDQLFLEEFHKIFK
jgi:lipoyl(octanoyl) transferase